MAGGFGNFDPSSYRFSDADLQQIISKTQDAVSEMHVIYNTVQAHTESLVDANRSKSGQILSNHLTTWGTDFQACVTSLSDLNHNAQGLLKIYRATDDGATNGAK
jgi:hypothetical protein